MKIYRCAFKLIRIDFVLNIIAPRRASDFIDKASLKHSMNYYDFNAALEEQ